MKKTPTNPLSFANPGRPSNGGRHEELVQLLTNHQNALLTYIRAAIKDLATAKDILQEVNLVIWRKADEFQPGSNFLGWAFRIAKFEILGHVRDNQREPLVFSEDSLDQFATELENIEQDWQNEERLRALEDCLKKLPTKQRELLQARYENRNKIDDLARSFDRSHSAIKMTLLRARQSLLECIQGEIKTSSQS